MWSVMDGWGWGIGHMLLWWVIIIAVVVLLVRLLSDTSRWQRGASTETPIDILNRRYANGDIDRGEYERRRSDILQA